jgi:NADH:ubiquinone oxidoreductase subunit 3 (subunit A)
VYTYVGLVLFLTGVNVGFSSLGASLGSALAAGERSYLLIPLAAILGWFIISAEPAVGVLEKQVEDVSAGAIPGRAIKMSLSIAIALAMAFAMLRVVTGISLLWFLVPGYVLALGLSFFVPDIYTAIAFDSGGVASGPMTATFMLQFMMGASTALGGNVLTDAFGVVALVAMMPLLSIQIVGFYYEHLAKEAAKAPAVYGDYDIIELWEESA